MEPLALGIVLSFLLQPLVAAAAPPPPRDKAEVEGVLARSPGPPAESRLRRLNIVLVANEKDHGLEEHDYPLWQKCWSLLLGGKGASEARQVNLYGPAAATSGEALEAAPAVTVLTAWGWPGRDQLESADLIVAFIGTGGRWNAERLSDLEKLLDRGKGFVALHSAVITSREFSRPLADLIGLAWEDGFTTFRHGPVELKIIAPDHPICLGLPGKIHFEDESYWPLVVDRGKVELLATADEREKPAEASSGLAPQPMFWTRERGKGRVFSAILGHYTWTFDDSYFRLLVLRGMAWAARESPYRFDPLVTRGARFGDGAVRPAPVAREKSKPVPPDPKDSRLLLWLDASDSSTLAVDGSGRVSSWASKASRVGRALSSAGDSRPLLVPKGLAGKPALRFDGKDDILRDTSFRQSVKDWTLFLVATVRSNEGGFRAFFSGNRPGVNDYISGINLDLGGGPSSLLDTINLEGKQHAGQSTLTMGATPLGTYIIVIRRGSGRAQAFINGLPEGGRSSSDDEASLEEIRLAARNYANPAGVLPLIESGHLDGDIAELVLYREDLPDAEREGVYAYLEEKYGAALTRPREPTLDEAFEKLPEFEIGGSRLALGPIDVAIAASHGDTEARRSIEGRLLAVLDRGCTRDAKDFICRRLGLMGSARSVPALAALLEDDSLSHLARIALERISGPEARAALREALARATGKARVGVIHSLGRLRDQESVPALERLLAGSEPEMARAAVLALGDLGAAKALEAFLGAAGSREGFRDERERSLAEAAGLALADLAWRLAGEGRKDEAISILGNLQSPASRKSLPFDSVHIAVLRGLARASPEAARPVLRRALEDPSPRIRAAAERTLAEIEIPPRPAQKKESE